MISLYNILEKKVIAFDVMLSHEVNNLKTNGRVVFANEGKGYDPSTGIFTEYAFTSFVVNGKIKSWNYCNDSVS